jgi:hypothetical protein
VKRNFVEILFPTKFLELNKVLIRGSISGFAFYFIRVFIADEEYVLGAYLAYDILC